MSMKIIKSFTHDEKTINVYGTFEEPLFLAKEIGEELGFGNIHSTLSNMEKEWKVTVLQTLDKGKPPIKRIFLKEPGLYYLLMRSYKEEAKPFQKWVVGEVLPTIRKTGKYEMENNTKQIKDRTVFKIETEYDLHSKVVHFIKCRFLNAVLLATLGELQDTDKKRIESYNMGIRLDLVIYSF